MQTGSAIRAARRSCDSASVLMSVYVWRANKRHDAGVSRLRRERL
jgi:hypothetical protein